MFSSSVFAQNKHLVTAANITELKLKPVDTEVVYLVVGKTTIGDNQGGLYYYDAAASDTEDLTYSNIIQSSLTGTGRFKKVNIRNIQLSHGLLKIDGGVKTFIANANTNASGEVTINLTYDNTTNGEALFGAQPWLVLCGTQPNNTNGNDVVFGQIKSYANSYKQGVFAFSRGGSTSLNLTIVTAGLAVLGNRTAANGTPICVAVMGM